MREKAKNAKYAENVKHAKNAKHAKNTEHAKNAKEYTTLSRVHPCDAGRPLLTALVTVCKNMVLDENHGH